MAKHKRGLSKGFTLIELLVVVMIIAILAATALPKYFRTVEKSRLTEIMTFSTALKSAQDRFLLANPGGYATAIASLDIEAPTFKYFSLAAPAAGAACSNACAGSGSYVVYTRTGSTPPGITSGYSVTFAQCDTGDGRFCISANPSLASW